MTVRYNHHGRILVITYCNVTVTVTLSDRDRGVTVPSCRDKKRLFVENTVSFVQVPCSRVSHTSHQRQGRPSRFRIVTAYLPVSQLVKTVDPAFNTYFQALQERQALSRSFFVLTRAAKGAIGAGRWIRAMRQRSPICHAEWLLRCAVARGLPFAVDAAASHLLEGDAAGFVAYSVLLVPGSVTPSCPLRRL